MKRNTAGFTLIELLIVVAIIGILAAIAVPNFLNAQIRAKIGRVQADLRSIATALESYRIDNNKPYPRDFNFTYKYRWRRLTTPVAYMSSGAFHDPFLDARYDKTNDGDPPMYYYETFQAYPAKRERFYSAFGQYKNINGSEYWTGSAGPNGCYNGDSGCPAELSPSDLYFEYNSSNGLRSNGDITRLGP